MLLGLQAKVEKLPELKVRKREMLRALKE